MEHTEDQLIRVDAGGWGLTWASDSTRKLRQVAVGPGGHLAEVQTDLRWYPAAFPTWGGGDPHLPAALRVTHADGMSSTRLVVEQVRRGTEKDGERVVVVLRDELQDLSVHLHLRTHPASGVLEQWFEIEHGQHGPVTLGDYDSVAPLLLLDEAAEICQFGGAGWADEWRWTTQRLTPGTLSLASMGGLQPHLQRSPCLLLSPDGPSTECEGQVLAFSVAWGGNVRFELDVRPSADPAARRELRLRAGANARGAEYVLDPGTRFVSPTVAWTWSEFGREEVTRRFHDWSRARVLRDPGRLRPLVANNWEATFFEFDEARIVGLIDRAAALGADVFLLDDGWFGTTYPRDDDTTSLGDWDPDPAKLPSGLSPLAQAAAAAGIRFGIWVEPEMVNPTSELNETHPEWVLRDRREPRLHRHQLVLDTLREDVRDFAATVVDRTLAEHPHISYVKWDANRPITDPGSAALGADRQANLWIDHARATWHLMDDVVQRHPETELMLCASGGGRTDHGTLRRFHEFWTSDNTDPVARIRMQWACTHFFPAAAMAAHVTRMGGRSIEFACAVALSGRFGFDLDLGSLSDSELETCRAAVVLARRTQDLVQQGVLVRLYSPVEGDDRTRAALMYHSADARRAVLFAYQLQDGAARPDRLVLRGLDPDIRYGVRTTDVRSPSAAAGEWSGRDLMETGLDWPLSVSCTARVWELDAQ